MNKKIVKIIAVIIFTLIFKLDMVNAADDKNYSCTYTPPGFGDFEGGVKIEVVNGNTYSASYIDTLGLSRGATKMAIKDDYNFEKKKEKNGCPKNVYLIEIDSNLIKDDVYELYIDETEYNNRIAGFNKKKKSSKYEIDSSTYVSKNESGKNLACSCDDSSKKFKFEYRVINNELNTATLHAPAFATGKEKVVINGVVQNFDKDAVVLGGITGLRKIPVRYNYLGGELKQNKCSTYAMVQKKAFNNYELFFSDVNRSKVFSDAIGKSNLVILTCSPSSDVPVSDNKNDQEPGTEEKHYDDADVNMVVTPLNFSLDTYSCGNGFLESIPVTIPVVGRIVYLVVQILVPVILIILGSLDLIKAVIGQKEDDIKKNQQVFVKRLIGAALIFFVFAIVKFVISIVSSDNSGNIMDCVDCIIRNSDNCKRE